MDPTFLNRNVNQGFSGGEKKRNEILQLAVLEVRLFRGMLWGWRQPAAAKGDVNAGGEAVSGDTVGNGNSLLLLAKGGDQCWKRGFIGEEGMDLSGALGKVGGLKADSLRCILPADRLTWPFLTRLTLVWTLTP